MSSYQVTSFSSLNGDTPEETSKMSKGDKDGCFVRTATGFVLVFLALAIAVGVGLIVHFTENRKLECTWPDPIAQVLSAQQQAKGCPTSAPAECPTCPSVTTATPPTPTQAPRVLDVRLSKSMIPQNYRIKVKPDMYGADPTKFTFTGHVAIDLDCQEPTDTVTLHIYMLSVSGILFTSAAGAGNSPHYVSHREDKDRQFLIIQLDRATQAGLKYTLEMDFTGPLQDDLQGFYLSSYKDGNQTKYLATTQFEPTDARKAFPCFDEPGMKATFQLTLVRKDNMKAVSNMRQENTTTLPDGFKEDVFEKSRKMSTYLVAYVIADFTVSRGHTTNGLTYGAWTRKSMSNQAYLALDVGIKTITNYEKYFNISFPLPKQDMIAIPDFGLGAMENWGLITYRETAMLFQPGVSSEYYRQRVTIVITHELAHQWFGDLVTMSWWDDIWLNEGFATFVEYLGADFLYPDWKMFDIFPMYEMHRAFEFDSLVTSHPIYVPLSNPDEIHEVFDDISYQKGGSVIRMMRFILGEDTFKKGLTSYLNAHKYDNAKHDDLWSALSEQSKVDNPTAPINVKEVMDTWTLQMNYPVVKVIYNNGRLTVSQKRFLKDPEAEDPGKYASTFGYLWQIPFTVTSSLNPDFDITNTEIKWLKTETKDLPYNSIPEDGWILGNVQQYGFYRVNYEDSNWQALTRQLKIKHEVFSSINRAQLVNDAWSLSKANQLSTDIALGILEYLDREMDYGPWYAARKQIQYLTEMLDKTDVYGPFKSFMQSKLKGPFDHYGMDDTNATHIESMTRSLVVELACQFDIAACVQQSQRLFQQWMDNPDSNRIDPDLRPAVYCTAIAEGGEEEWNFAFNQFQSAAVVAERDTLSTSLACTRSPWILSKYLELSINPSVIRKQDATSVIIAIAQNPIGRLLAWDFVRGRWEYLQDTYGKGVFSFAKLIAGLTNSFNTEFQLKQLNSFLEQYPDMGTGNRAFQQAIEKTVSNIKWVNSNKETISRWLTSLNAAKKSQVKDVRLPRHLEPISYDLTLKPNMYSGAPENFTFEGSVKIHMSANEVGRNVTLHTNSLTIVEESIKFAKEDGSQGPAYNGQRIHDNDRQFEIFYLTDDLVSGQNYYIEMNFTGPLLDDLAGLYLSTYKRNNETVYLATTQLEATDARKAFPCFDEPELKATFKVSLIRKKNLVSISNMPIITTTTIDNEFERDDYNTSAKMSTYLLAFIVCDFEYKEGQTRRGTKYRAFARPESINQTVVALKAGVDILSFYEHYFGIDFPLPKQDMIAIPDFSAGAMENWGLITYRETAMLYEPGVSSSSNLQRVNVVVAHELAHQWFGNLVTMDWWDDLWLNEGFATLIEYLGTDHQHPDWKMFDQFVLDLHDVFDIDALTTSHPIYVPVQNPEEINEIFDTISYAKGGSVLRMARFFLGETTFQLGVQRYLKKRKFQNANHDDLWLGLQEEATAKRKNINVQDIMDTWILQMNYPVVMVKSGTNGNIEITQERFLVNKDAKDPGKYPSKFDYKWKIPFTYTTDTHTQFNQTDSDVIWLDDTNKDLGVRYPANGWIVGNIQQYGVYRVNYEQSNWNKLIEVLKTQHQAIHLLNRGQIINDAFGLAKAKQLPMDTALRVLEYLKDETEFIPWSAADSEISYINQMLAEAEIYGDFQRFVLEILHQQYDRLGLNNTGSSLLDSYLRSAIAGNACYFGNEGCIKDATELYQTYIDDDSFNPVDPDLKSTVYCTAVREGGEKEWQFTYNMYKSATVQAEKSRLLSAMCCTRQPWIINKVLAMSLDAKIIKKQDAYRVYVYFGRNPAGRTMAWNFLKSNWDDIFERYGKGSFSLGDIISGITRSFNTEYQLTELKDFRKQHPDMGSGTQAFSRAQENTQSNIEWMKDNYNTIKNWLSKHNAARSI